MVAVSDKACIKAYRLYQKLGSYRLVARELGLTRSQARHRAIKGESLVMNPHKDEEVDQAKDSPPPKHLHESATVSTQGFTGKLEAQGRVKALEDLLRECEVDTKAWRVSKFVANKWDGQLKGGDPIPLWQVKAWLERRPAWAEMALEEHVRHIKRLPPKPKNHGFRSALVIPDSQNGYRWNRHRTKLIPMHDRKAWDLAIQAAMISQPEVIILLGDMLDNAPWSDKFPSPQDVIFTSQPALNELHWWLAQLRMASPRSQIVYLEGNHEVRIKRAVIEKMKEADELRPVDDLDGHPLISVPRLLALDKIDVEYVEPYDTDFWLWDCVRIHHGVTARKGGGATVKAVANDATHHDIFGHVHRFELCAKTIHGPKGKKVVWIHTPGTITSTDPGIVPANTNRPDWQQGLSFLHLKDEDDMFVEPVSIQKGSMVWRGQLFQGEERLEDIKEAFPHVPY